MKLFFFPAVLLLQTCLCLMSCTGPVSYYISKEGDDSNPGTSPGKAWQSIRMINARDLAPGDRILLRGGDTFTGTISLSAEDSGTPSSRLLVSSYGEGRAVLYGGTLEALRADSCQYLTIENLELRGAGRKDGNAGDGLHIYQCDGVVLNDLEVHGFQHSGIHLHGCDDANITRVYAHENGFAGILVSGTSIRDTARYDNHRLYIGYCIAENNPGDPTVLDNHSGNGILASSVKQGTIEYCEAFNNGWDMPWNGNGPVGIWIWDCTDFTIQHCISHHNRTNPVAKDGGGFDLDGGVSNSVIQYCISHNNEGAGYGLYEFGATKPWENNIIRYNISQDDGIINVGSLGIWKNDGQGVMRNCLIYNNTFYNSLEGGSSIWLYDHYPGFRFYNNVFVYKGALVSEGQSLKDEFFLGNLYWDLAGGDSFFGYDSMEDWARASGNEMIGDKFIGLYEDPLLNKAGSLEVTDPSKISYESLAGYVPRPGSPLVDRGVDLRTLLNIRAGEKDLIGTTVPKQNIFDIGAIELDH